MNVFISGGCKNGKSHIAQTIARDAATAGGRPLYYIATMIPHDAEDHARIARHIRERDGWGFTTIEQPTNLCACLDDGRAQAGGVFLLDSVTALLSNEMFREDGSMDYTAPDRVTADLCEFARRTGSTVFVSDYIYSDAHRYDKSVEAYRKGLAQADRALAKLCERVLEVAYGSVRECKSC